MENLISEVADSMKRSQRKQDYKIAREDLIRQATKRAAILGLEDSMRWLDYQLEELWTAYGDVRETD